MKTLTHMVVAAAAVTNIASTALGGDTIKVKREYYTPYGKVKVKEYYHPRYYRYPYYYPPYNPYYYPGYYPPYYTYDPYHPPAYGNPPPGYGGYRNKVED